MATTADRPVAEDTLPAAGVPGAGGDADSPAVDRGGMIGLWALLGVVALAIAGQAWIRWIASSTQFSPAPLNNADHYAQWRWVSLRLVELISAIVFVWLANVCVIRPLRRDRRLGIDGKIAIACLLGSITDGVLNMFQYLFAWNAHSINLGSWSAFLPLHSSHANARYAEALVWGLPMYVYFCIGVAIAGCLLVSRLRARWPSISNMRALAYVYVAAFVFDFVVENGIIRLTQAYSFAKTAHGVTLWPGSLYQFPLYESVFVAALGTIFTALRLSAIDSGDGVSFVERGYERVRPSLQTPARLVAVIGFSITTLFVVYHLPFNWLGVTGTSVAHLPSYMLP
jgi:hypothetical protein